MMGIKGGERAAGRRPEVRPRIGLGADRRFVGLVGLSAIAAQAVGGVVTQWFGAGYGLPAGVVILVAGIRLAKAAAKGNAGAMREERVR